MKSDETQSPEGEPEPMEAAEPERRMRISAKAVYLCLAGLFIAMVVLVVLNHGDSALKRALEENREFQIKVNGEITDVIELQDLLDLSPQEFKTTLASSSGLPREVTLQGVELRLILEAFAVDTKAAKSFVFSGLDGYYSPLTEAEVNREESIYICFSMDGEILKKQSEGGYGPFLMVIRGSRFAQRWCKYVEAVDVITGS